MCRVFKIKFKSIQTYIKEFQLPLIISLIYSLIMLFISINIFEIKWALSIFFVTFVLNFQLISFLLKKKYPIWNDLYGGKISGWFFAVSYVFGDVILIYILLKEIFGV